MSTNQSQSAYKLLTTYQFQFNNR